MLAHNSSDLRDQLPLIRTLAVVTLALGLGMGVVQAQDKPAATQPAATDTARAARAESDADAPAAPSLSEKLGRIMQPVNVQDRPFKQAVQWWSDTTGVPILADWDGIERANVNLEQPVTVKLPQAPVMVVLRLILREGAPETPMIAQVTPWYVQVMTKSQANRARVTKVYDVRDLVLPIPNFDKPNQLSLRGSQNGSRSSGGSLYSGGSGRNTTGNARDDRGQNLVQLIKETIEPEVWADNGALGSGGATIRYYDGHLIVNAPQYVHDQIGSPTPAPKNGNETISRRVTDFPVK